jgi:hypothetical protein
MLLHSSSVKMPPPRLILLFNSILSSVTHRLTNSSHFSRSHLFRDIYSKKMRCTKFAAAPTAATVSATTATAAAAAVVSFRFYDYSPSNATVKPKPR